MNDKYKHILSAYTRNQDSLLAVLIAVQKDLTFLSPEAIREIARHLKLTDNEVYGLASFYPPFRFSAAVTDADALEPSDGENPVPLCGGDQASFRNIDEYLAEGGFEGLSKALRLLPEELAEDVRRSGLKEVDGADHCLDNRWQQCRQAPGEKKFLIVHAAAAEQMALDARYLIEGNLFHVLEGMLIAAYAAGAGHGIVCIDSRYAEILPLLDTARRQLQAAGYLGAGISESAFNFDLIFQVVAGPVRWGDGRQLMAALEGRRILECEYSAAFHGFPTVMHTPEMLRQLPAIVSKGAEWYAGLGVNGHPGTQIITLGGKVRNPGCYEIPMGTPLRDIVASFGGGLQNGEILKAVQVGGPTGGWIPADELDIPLDHQSLASAGASLGPGIVSVATQGDCILDLACQALVYARRQSCGHCLFCREGTRQMAEILTNMTEGNAKPEDLEVLAELAEGLKLNSACCLGRTAPDAFLCAMRYFREEIDAHLEAKRCPARICSFG